MAAKSLKGFGYEREVCHRLTCWWMGDPDYDDVIFWRTAGSGGRATSRAKKGKKTSNAHGDITFTDPIGKPFVDLFTVEMKRGYNRNSLNDLIDRLPHLKEFPEDSYADWLRKLEAKRVETGTPYWLLIHRRDKRGALAFYPTRLRHDLEDQGVRLPAAGRVLMTLGGVKFDVCAVSFDAFLGGLDRKTCERLGRRER